MIIDLHTHTAKHSGCSNEQPEKMIEAAIDAGLDGIVLTEHDKFWDPEDISKLQSKYNKIKIFSAIEVTINEKEHVLVYGVLNPKGFYHSIPLKELEKIVKAEDGMMVIAHPYRYKESVTDEIFECNIEAIEVASCNVLSYMKDGMENIKNRKTMIEVAGSDAHKKENIGMFATDFNRNIKDEKDLVKAIRENNHAVFKDKERVEKLNKVISKKVVHARALIEEGKPDLQIKKIAGIPGSFVYAIKNEKSVEYLL